ncbi:F-box protein At3g07870-like [Solanum pennellii]|uniref:F-box protein At3g07870-like n=1 Tax=Solanum pennellii TaxID=28526 RepID=A0ABM1GSJ3_SOLPN|nr:F-box protein At3g07870-like [Solanum pennellii]
MDPGSSMIIKRDCKKRRISHVTEIINLPKDIMLEILSRLSIKSIFCCKTVCKSWYSLITYEPLFVDMYHKRSSSNFPSLLVSINDTNHFFVELKAIDSQPLEKTIALNPKFHLPSSDMRLIGSCNGFVCFLKGGYDMVHTLYISNPLLGEYYKVKMHKREKIYSSAYAFCFSEASRQYKVLRSAFEHPKVSELEVYTVGVDKKWRYVGKAPKPLWKSFSNANVNGIVHWMDPEKNDTIYSFNSWTEEVKSLLAPRGLITPSYKLTLVELRNCLCLCDSNDSEYIDIWWMKEYGITESWTKTHILKDTIQPDFRSDRFIPILTWKDGEILMQRDGGMQVVSYNPKEEKFTKIRVYFGYEATRYIPSFYSVKTIVEESSQVSYIHPKIDIV